MCSSIGEDDVMISVERGNETRGMGMEDRDMGMGNRIGIIKH